LLSEEEKNDVQVLAVSNDSHDESQVMLRQLEQWPGRMDYPLLQDRGFKTIAQYGIYNPAEFKPGIPYPVVYIIGKDGLVMDRLLDQESLSRATNFQIREALQKIGAIR
jgi:alkyl hydroperoxide reductase subunit AhpC